MITNPVVVKLSLLISNQDGGCRHFAQSERLSSAAWLSLGFSRALATEPGKHTKEPPGHELDPATHDSTHDDTADSTQSLDPNFSLDPHEILTTTRLEFHKYPASTWSTLH